MATFNKMQVTNEGKKIYAKAMAGKVITFSNVAFGSGMPASQDAATSLTALVSQEIVGAIESIDTTSVEGVATITVTVTNTDLVAPIGIKEIGVFCTDPDTGLSVMYAYCYSPTDIDVIPSNENGVITWKMRIQLAINNATGSTTTQNAFMDFTPVVTATAASGVVKTFVSEIIANGKYLVSGGLLTAFYEITGRLSNMETAESELKSLTISLPRVANGNYNVQCPMSVKLADNTSVIVDISGEIVNGGEILNIDYFGSQNGTFALKMQFQYRV